MSGRFVLLSLYTQIAIFKKLCSLEITKKLKEEVYIELKLSCKRIFMEESIYVRAVLDSVCTFSTFYQGKISLLFMFFIPATFMTFYSKDVGNNTYVWMLQWLREGTFLVSFIAKWFTRYFLQWDVGLNVTRM